MKKIGFVAPWYGEKIPGGAEMELRGLVHHLKDVGVEVEVLTTCVKDFMSNWNENYYKEKDYKKDIAYAKQIAKEALDLPLYGTLLPSEVEYICDMIYAIQKEIT